MRYRHGAQTSAAIRMATTATVLIAIVLLLPAQAIARGPLADRTPIEMDTTPISTDTITSTPPARRGGAKLDSALAAVADAAGKSAIAALEVAAAGGLHTARGRVHALVTVRRDGLDAVRRAISDAGGEVTGVGNRDRYVQAFLAPGKLRLLATDADVVSIRRPQSFFAAAGSQMTQGDAALNGALWRSAGFDGTGIKIGIIDIGFIGYTNLLGSDLPSSVTTMNFADFGDVQGPTEHGTACAEIIHDVAPGAQLYLARVSEIVDIEEAADWLESEGVDIISSSIGTYNVTPGDGTGYFEDIIAEKRAAGITWFTAASNDREAHWGGTSNIGAGDYHVFDAATGQNVNFFGPGNGQAYLIPPGFGFEVNVRWSDWTDVDQDFDLYLVRRNRNTGEWVEMSSQVGGLDAQTGDPSHLPVETAFGVTTGQPDKPTAYGFVVHRYLAAESVTFEMFAPAFADLDERVEERSLSNLADANSAITVAAIDVTTFDQEFYSSEGPTNGPGGILTGGQPKPDISAFANVNTVSYGPGVFNGTSSATPHTAAAAALVLDANPTYLPDDIDAFLTGHAVDLGAPTFDTDYGHGRVHLGDPPAPWDSSPPVVTAPDADFRQNVNVGKGSAPVKLRVDFTVEDDSAIASTDLQQRVGSGAFVDVAMPAPTAVSVDMSVSTGSTMRQFRARATDAVSNTSDFATATATPFTLRAFQNGNAAIIQSGPWTTQSKSGFYGGSVRRSSTNGPEQSLTAQMQDVAIVSTLGSNRGIAQVWVDGFLEDTIDLYSPTTEFRRVVWTMDFGTPGSHTVVLRVTGTKNPASTGTRVDLDAILVMQP